MASVAPEVDEIRRQMAQIRRELHEDMQGVVAGAEVATDWKYYVRLYPWACLAAAFAVGFLIVPRRRSVSRAAEAAAEATAARLTEAIEEARPVPGKTVEKEKRKSGLLGALLGMATPILWRVAQNYVTGYASNLLENWLAQQGMMGPLAAGGPSEPGGPHAS
ncbi:MAG: hypothetical protein IRY99_00715 [Isosphaeraceae bacterium]|nr:hypothetical protein [Isosphaeraceae bacterium]